MSHYEKMSTRSKMKDGEEIEVGHNSTYQTRSKRKSEEHKEDLRKFQDTASILINEKPFTICVGYCYLVSLSNKIGWLRIDKLWMFDEILKMETTCFTRPSASKCKRWEYGQDQLLAYNADLLLTGDRFKQMYIQKENSNQNGSYPIPISEIVKREKESLTYFQMKNSKSDIKDNISASALVHTLGFARFNAGAKKKNPSPTQKRSREKSDSVGVVLNYKDYCMHRKLKKLLESGGVASKEECERYHVVSDQPIKVFYRNQQISYSPREEVMDGIDDGMFEKFSKNSKEDDARLKRLTGKYRRQSI